MEKLAENDLAYFYLRHVVIVETAVVTISLTLVTNIQYKHTSINFAPCYVKLLHNYNNKEAA
jgi:hypothetical protein